MATTSTYSKVYPMARFREFPAWTEKIPGLQVSDELEAYAFLHDSYVVTADVFVDQKVVFDEVTAEWVDFCKNCLGFVVPPDVADAPASPVDKAK